MKEHKSTAPKWIDYDEAEKMYKAGMSTVDIAKFYGISTQSVSGAFRRRKVKMRPRVGKNTGLYRGGDSSRDPYASMVVNTAIAKGILTPKPCEVCGFYGVSVDGSREVDAHHDDYSKPLDVRWLCAKHHHEWHKHNKAKPNVSGKYDRKGLLLSGHLIFYDGKELGDPIECAKRLGIKPRRVEHLIKTGRLLATKMWRRWWIETKILPLVDVEDKRRKTE